MQKSTILAAAAFLALTVLLTFPQAGQFASVPYQSDPYFSIWRLGWIAYALRRTPEAMFDANIFHPEPLTLAYSDAMLLPGVILAPLFWSGLNPVIIYNVALFAALALSGLAAFTLARLLTGEFTASFVAGMIYAFAPYRFTHYAHLELQLVFWIPLLLVAIHRSLPRPAAWDGALIGAIVGVQLLSSIYAGIFAVMFCAIFIPCLMAITNVRPSRAFITPLILAGAVTLLLALPYALPYLAARSTVGTRSIEDVRVYSASPVHYAAAPRMNRLYGGSAITEPLLSDEINLFPGVGAIALALAGIFGGPSRVRYAYLAGAVLAVVMAAGANGPIYAWLFEEVPLFRALRSPARFGILLVLCLAVLSAYGASVLLNRIGSGRRRIVASSAMVMLLMAEYASEPTLARAPAPSQVDAYLALKPSAVLIELPVVSDTDAFGSVDWIHMYQALPHFHRMLNGYSGFAPASFYRMRDIMSGFPDDRSVAFLRSRRVDYVVFRAELYDDPERAAGVLEQMRRRREFWLEAIWNAKPDAIEALFKVLPAAATTR
jgi:hypothetical protein